MKLLLLIMACLTLHDAFAQAKEEKFFVFDKEWKPTGIKNAVYFLRVRKTEEKNYVWLMYNIFGPRISKENFSDEAGKIRNGECLYYHLNGFLDSTGKCSNGVQTGSWHFFNQDGSIIRRKDYDNSGLLIKDTLYAEHKADVAVKPEPVPGEVESSFSGGPAGWARYLNKNITYPERAMSAKVMGRVVLQFIVDESGKVLSPEINKSLEYSLDEEALRIIQKSPNWSPATKDGKVLKSYKKQPITFSFS